MAQELYLWEAVVRLISEERHILNTTITVKVVTEAMEYSEAQQVVTAGVGLFEHCRLLSIASIKRIGSVYSGS